MKQFNKYHFRSTTAFDKFYSYMRRPQGLLNNRLVPKLDESQQYAVDCLKNNGCVILPNYVSGAQLDLLQQQFQNSLNKLCFQTPVLAQSRLNSLKDADLLQNNLFASVDTLRSRGLTFDDSECQTYEQVVSEFRPSTLTVPMLEHSRDFQNLWLDENIISIVSKYIGSVPVLHEAYVRRNFPANHKTMNHYWHRDLNHKHFLVKVFFFLTDCNMDTGPHEYIKGTHNNFKNLNDKRYFTDEEVDECFPISSSSRTISNVSAGTVVIEDTRGLHRAQVPNIKHRDLGFAVFMPSPDTSPNPYYYINRMDYELLSKFQRSVIPTKNIR